MNIIANNSSTITRVAGLAALLYSSWVLGYMINPRVAVFGAASELSATGQPFRELFIVSDVVAAILMFIVGHLLWIRHNSAYLRMAIAMYVLAGVFIAVAANISLLCSPSLEVCDAKAFTDRAMFHNLAGAIASFFIFLNLFFTIQAVTKNISIRLKFQILIIVWGILGLSSLYIPADLLNPAIHAAQQRLFLGLSAYYIWLSPKLLQ
ncbi:MAG: hypothetical protein WAT23_14145 [Chromatiaceae bacterium]